MFAESSPIKNNIRFLTNKMLDRFFKKQYVKSVWYPPSSLKATPLFWGEDSQ
jgi:hypothetical protein